MKRPSALCSLWISLATVAAQSVSDNEWEKISRAAYAQHEIVALSIRQSNVAGLLPEMRKFYSLRFPAKYESMLSGEIELVADALMHVRQFAVAYQIIDEGLQSLRIDRNKAAVLRKKAYILKKQGRDAEALRYFKQSVSLEAGRP